MSQRFASRAGLLVSLVMTATVGFLSLQIGLSVLRAAEPLSPSVRPTTRVMNCTEGGCHGEQIDHEILHGPVVVGACDMCHSYIEVAEHTFKLKGPKEKLCEFCHIGQAEGVVVHEPVAQGQCLDCHDPHGADNVEMLREDNVGKMCSSCHDDVTRGRRYTHGPVATGSCAACHRSHTSPYPNLLSTTGRQLCIDCHQDMGRQIDTVRYVHEPVKGDCLQCHETHASNHANHLKAEPVDLCVSCHEHEDIKKLISNVAIRHSPVTDGPACMNCHVSHGGNWPVLANDEGVASCLSCHDRPILDFDGQTRVAGMAELARPGSYKHGPIRDGNCSECHDVHGGAAAQLLIAPYPKTFYESFEVDTYGLCFACHTDQLALARQTTTVTDFRNGKTNLHYVHVNRPKEGRSCRACHSTHASTNPMHIAETVPFGDWELPVSFTPTETGGTCASGCHERMDYDRINPVPRVTAESETVSTGSTTDSDAPTEPNDGAAPRSATAPASAPAPAEIEGTSDEHQPNS
ncbi:hypothetical protein LCGC14_0254190 [marine sediment metagenome]|uniref:Doubled CXXCH motif domain-containing protein n=1 Tax=marine sediment metagenome TaxID=412755 RepID=A0A0F9X8G4_9ZZZZ|nr:hypothetical protein [Phycisphaerae bacterium]HDZ45102.1 hypothetical protein [Phycisphaerae bacterium]